MLSIKPIGGSDRQVGYYARLGQEDYYLRGGEPPGVWWGAGAERLGLSGKVEAGTFGSLLRGYLPSVDKSSKRKLVQNAGQARRRSGFDLTFSAPKSISILWALSDERRRKEIERCLQRAVTEALGAFSRLCGQTRRGKGGLQIEQADLVVAMFRHETARGVGGSVPDPNLHWHTVVCNLVVREDGSTSAFDARRLFRPQMKMLLGALFRAELAKELDQLGLDCHRPTNDRGKQVSWFELSGVPPDLIKAFSKRRQDMETWMSERSLSGTAASQRAALATRGKKIAYARQELLTAWQAVGQAHGFTAEKHFGLRRTLDVPLDKRQLGELALSEALAEIMEQRARFSELELLRFTAQAAQGRSLGIDDIFQVVNHAIKYSPELICLQSHDGERHFTTREMLALEQRLFATVKRLHESDLKPVAKETMELVLAEYPTVQPEQAAAVRHITSGPGQIACVNGLAGTGKTFMLQIARRAWEKAGFNVLGTTLAAKASQTLAAGSGIESFHLHPLLHQITTGQRRLNDRSVLVLDEAGMVGTRQLEQVVALVEQAKAKLVMVGDHRQLQAIEAGAPFRAITERIGAAKLDNVIRQREPWARKAVVGFSQGEAKSALQRYADKGLLCVEEDRSDAMNRLVTDWMPTFKSHPQETLIFAGTRLEVVTLNRRCQELRLSVDDLSGESVSVDRQTFHVGDRILFTRNKPSLLVKNGSTGTVVALDQEKQTLHVRLDDGLQVQVNVNLYPHLALGYALSTHKGQGITVDSAFVLTGAMNDRELTYVQASRARGVTRIYADLESGGVELEMLTRQMKRSHAKELAHDFLLEAM